MQNEIKERFYYEESRFDLPLRYRYGYKAKKAGDVAGCLPSDSREYAKVKLNGATLTIHQAVWMYFNGKPDSMYVIDHINGNKMDNRISNLRLISNAKNKRRGSISMYKSNSSGVTGVVKSSCGKWKVSFRLGGKLHYFGVYSDLSEAICVCKEKRKIHFPESIRP